MTASSAGAPESGRPIVVAAVDMLAGRAVPDIVQTIVGIGIGTAGTIIGVNFGIVLQPSPAPGGQNPGGQNGAKP